MNRYPVWWSTTVTLYNKYEDSRGEVTWYRTVLNGCFWKYVGDKVRVGDTVLSTNDTVCRIRKSDAFLEQYAWKQADDKSSYFTIGRGDIIIRGEVEDEIDEYTKGERSSDMLEKYKDVGCIKVEEFAINTGVGRADEHYRIRGI